MDWLFVIPPTDAFVSGGNIYNSKLIEALRSINVGVSQCSLEFYLQTHITADVVVIDSFYLKPPWNGDLVKIKGRLKTIFLAHHLSSLYPGPTSLFKHEKQVMENMDCIVVTGKYLEDKLNEHNLPPITCIPPAYISKRSAVVSPQHSTMILMVNNLIRRKGVMEFLQEIASQPFPVPFYLQIAGSSNLDPEYAQKCLIFARKNHIPLHYSGEVNHEEIDKLYSSARLLVSASWMETFGMQIQEALAYNVPVVALKKGNIPYLIKDGVNGLLADDHKSLYQNVLDFLTGKKTIASPGPVYRDNVQIWGELAKEWRKLIRA